MKIKTKKLYKALGSIAIALSLSLQMSCKDPVTFDPEVKESFVNYGQDHYQQVSKLLQADYLIVLDTSLSMRYVRDQIANALFDFEASLKAENIDYNIAFAHGMVQSTSTVSEQLSSQFMLPILNKKNPMSSSYKSLFENFGLPLNPNEAHMLSSASWVMHNQSQDFLRPNAQLVYAFITDDEDLSALPGLSSNNSIVNAYVNTGYDLSGGHTIKGLAQYKDDPAYINARAVIAGHTSTNSSGQSVACNLDLNRFQRKATLLDLAAKELNSQSANTTYCVNDLAKNFLNQLARDVTKTNKKFKLRGTADEDTISVSVKNQGSSTFTSKTEGVDYRFDVDTNEIIFFDGREPATDAALQVDYQTLIILTKDADPSSLIITVNGSKVSPSAVNGWTFNPASKRITFHGAAIPAHDDEILITYQERT